MTLQRTKDERRREREAKEEVYVFPVALRLVRPPIYREMVEHLIAEGFTYVPESCEWTRGDERGRLSTSCWQDEAWLTFPRPHDRETRHYAISRPALRITREQMLAGE